MRHISSCIKLLVCMFLLCATSVMASNTKSDYLFADAVDLYMAGDRETAEHLFEQFIHDFPEDQRESKARFILMNQYMREGAYEKAYDYGRQLLTDKDNEHSDALAACLCVIAYKTGREQKAEEVLNLLEEHYPDSQHTTTARLRLKELSKETALSIEPRNASTLNDKGGAQEMRTRMQPMSAKRQGVDLPLAVFKGLMCLVVFVIVLLCWRYGVSHHREHVEHAEEPKKDKVSHSVERVDRGVRAQTTAYIICESAYEATEAICDNITITGETAGRTPIFLESVCFYLTLVDKLLCLRHGPERRSEILDAIFTQICLAGASKINESEVEYLSASLASLMEQRTTEYITEKSININELITEEGLSALRRNLGLAMNSMALTDSFVASSAVMNMISTIVLDVKTNWA